MSKHDPEVALKQILSHAREAVDICRGKTRDNLDSDRLLNLALTRLIEIIGEAANRVPESIQVKYPDLPWMQMIGARNRLIHGYDSVDFSQRLCRASRPGSSRTGLRKLPPQLRNLSDKRERTRLVRAERLFGQEVTDHGVSARARASAYTVEFANTAAAF